MTRWKIDGKADKLPHPAEGANHEERLGTGVGQQYRLTSNIA